MTQRPANTRVQHGSAACADYGCRRQECLDARRFRQKRNKLLRNTGRPGRVSAARAAAHIERFRQAGVLDKEIIPALGVARNTFYRVVRGLDLTRESEQRILAVPVPGPAIRVTSLTGVPAVGTHRRLQALLRQGWPSGVLEERIGVHYGWITRSSRRNCVTMATRSVVGALYDELWNVSPESRGVDAGRARSTRELAAASGFHGPLSWDDATIDDPQARPYAPSDEDALAEDFVDPVAVRQFVAGRLFTVSDAEFLEAVRKCRAMGLSNGDIDTLHRVTRKSTENALNRIKKAYTRSGKVFPELGSAPGQAQFTVEQVVKIREQYAVHGGTDLELAMQYGVARSAISALLSGRSYSSVGGPIREIRSAKPAKSTKTLWALKTPASANSFTQAS